MYFYNVALYSFNTHYNQIKNGIRLQKIALQYFYYYSIKQNKTLRPWHKLLSSQWLRVFEVRRLWSLWKQIAETRHWRDFSLHMVCVSLNHPILSLSPSLWERYLRWSEERLGNPVLDAPEGAGRWTICIEWNSSLIKMLSACCFWNISKASFSGSCYAGNYRSSR